MSHAFEQPEEWRDEIPKSIEMLKRHMPDWYQLSDSFTFAFQTKEGNRERQQNEITKFQKKKKKKKKMVPTNLRTIEVDRPRRDLTTKFTTGNFSIFHRAVGLFVVPIVVSKNPSPTSVLEAFHAVGSKWKGGKKRIFAIVNRLNFPSVECTWWRVTNKKKHTHTHTQSRDRSRNFVAPARHAPRTMYVSAGEFFNDATRGLLIFFFFQQTRNRSVCECERFIYRRPAR